ncbi:MAG: hypothetical protein K1V95_03940 [Eubacterium sp.]
MREFRKKQKKFYKIMKTLIIFSVVFILVYIGAQPYVAQASNIAAIVCSYFCQFLIVANLCFVFAYYNKYAKSDKFLETVEYEISDYGYYYSARTETGEADFMQAMQKDIAKSGFTVLSDIEIDEFDFAFSAFSKKDFFYAAQIESLSRSDILAYIDAVIHDITVQNLKRKGNAVLCFVTDKAEEEAIAISKMITPLGKKEQITIALAIVQPGDKRCYFLGNMQTRCRLLIANFVLKCGIPIPDTLKGEKRLPFQDALEQHMQDFDIKSFKNGTFYAH